MSASRPLLVVLLAGALLLAAPSGPKALAADGPPDALSAVRALERLVDDPGSSWAARWKAYKQAKEALSAAEGEAKAEATAAYEQIRARVAKALQRGYVPVSGWIMGFVAALLLWGGLALHFRIAMKSRGTRHPEPLEEDETWPLRPEDGPDAS